jgi:L-amino acid N-acyltransferase YncA
MMEIRPIEPADHPALERFLSRVPEGDRTFFKEDVDDPAVVEAWIRPEVPHALALEDGEVIGYVAVVPQHGWSSHVGEVRVIVDPDHRGKGVGQALARRAVIEALRLGLTKMVVEVIADQEATIAMFGALGFDPEALLRDHVLDQSGELRDLLVLAHSVEESYAAMEAAGLADILR